MSSACPSTWPFFMAASTCALDGRSSPVRTRVERVELVEIAVAADGWARSAITGRVSSRSRPQLFRRVARRAPCPRGGPQGRSAGSPAPSEPTSFSVRAGPVRPGHRRSAPATGYRLGCHATRAAGTRRGLRRYSGPGWRRRGRRQGDESSSAMAGPPLSSATRSNTRCRFVMSARCDLPAGASLVDFPSRGRPVRPDDCVAPCRQVAEQVEGARRGRQRRGGIGMTVASRQAGCDRGDGRQATGVGARGTAGGLRGAQRLG